ncbi:GRIP/coiled-coil protein [Tasmannia lanceolata]|uniref:GRIP/coiled-coil protein n=1 Tax=Tasmannia lanceolata TaxID=3420 RepID=UPI0040649F09
MRGRGAPMRESALTRAVNSVFKFFRLAEFEILFFLFLLIAFLIFKDLTSRPEYNQILLKKPNGGDFWPYQ